MGRLNRQRALLVFGLIVVALLFALGCTRIDATATAIATVEPTTSALTAMATSAAEPTASQNAEPTLTPGPPTPTPVSPECAEGLRLNPGEACIWSNGAEIDFLLSIDPDGTAVLNGAIGDLQVEDRRAEPGDKLCACDLRTEPDGLARIITALPEPAPEIKVERFVFPPSPFLGECLVGMDVEVGELCWYPGSQCIFEVRLDGSGHFLDTSASDRFELSGLTKGELTFDFQAVRSGNAWNIQNVPQPQGDRSLDYCSPDQEIEEFASAIRNGDIAAVRRFIDSGANLNARDYTYGRPLLAVATTATDERGKIEVVQMLIDAGADVNNFDSGGRPMVNVTALRGSSESLRVLLNAGADPNVRDMSGYPALERAFQRNSPEVIHVLVEGGADVNARDHAGDPLLYHQLTFGSIENVQAFIEAGADVHGLSKRGVPLLRSAISGGIELIRIMLDAGADVNARGTGGRPVLAYAMPWSYPEEIGFILEAGADPDACDAAGNPLLYNAIRGGHGENVRVLVDAGANVDAYDARGDPLLAVALIITNEYAATILIDAGADVNAIDSDGKTMLELARQVSSGAIVQYLIDVGAE